MKEIFAFIAVVFLCNFTFAQSSSPDVLSSGGGFASGPGFTNSFTIGQASIPETYTTGTFILTQGFQQPSDIGTGLAPINLASTNIGTFPNPSNGQFFLEYTLDENAFVTIDAFDVLGQRIYTETTARSAGKQLQEVNLSGNANGIYFVNCTIKTPAGTSTTTSKITVTK
ncbi:MAG: T9SS type A sorting domain-containing protein [Bacteroidia bacterium]